MSRFYLLSEILSPLFAWGFLGTDDELHQRCQRFKVNTYYTATTLNDYFTDDFNKVSTINIFT